MLCMCIIRYSNGQLIIWHHTAKGGQKGAVCLVVSVTKNVTAQQNKVWAIKHNK